MRKRDALIIGAAAAGIYGAATGKGIFNKWKYREQLFAVNGYIRSHHPGAHHSEITKTNKGYMTVISRNDNSPKIVLYISKTPEGVYVFDETEVINS